MSVVSVCVVPDRYPVYNLTVEPDHAYYARGILVHNCDMLRYGVMDLTAPPHGIDTGLVDAARRSLHGGRYAEAW